MQYGLCYLSVVALRSEATDTSELISQVLYGDHFKVLEHRKSWSRIRLGFDKYEGWIDNKQFQFIDELEYKELHKSDPLMSTDLVDFIVNQQQQLHPILLGSALNGLSYLGHAFEGAAAIGTKDKSKLVDTAISYLNTPYLWGGKTPFGVDCSGLVQMVYKINGYSLFRDASQQATQGEVLSFIEESEAGDLAFFDNDEGNIVHVGILLNDNYIIHAHGKVRIDRIDHLGIFNQETGKHTHPLRVIKKMI